MERLNLFVSAAVSIITVVASVISARLTARYEAKQEFKRLMAQWNREDISKSREAFSNMVKNVSAFCSFSSGLTQKSAVESISFFSTFVTDEELSALLSQLLLSVQSKRAFEAKSLLKQIQDQTNKLWNDKRCSNKKLSNKKPKTRRP